MKRKVLSIQGLI